jgi:hypothetical protein
MLPLGHAAAALAGEVRAALPFPPRPRRAPRSKADTRVAWILDIQIASAVWAAGYDIATANRSDFVAIAEAIEAIAPGGARLNVTDPEV